MSFLSLATKGILCPDTDIFIIRRIIYPLNITLTNVKKILNLIFTSRKINVKLQKTNAHIRIQELKVHTKKRSYKVNIKEE